VIFPTEPAPALDTSRLTAASLCAGALSILDKLHMPGPQL